METVYTEENPVVGFTCNGVPIRKNDVFRSLVQKPKEESKDGVSGKYLEYSLIEDKEK